MAKPLLLSLSLCLVMLFNGCLARRNDPKQFQNRCQLDRLDALEPDNRIEAEAGLIEFWNPNHDQFQCAGVAVVRRTIEKNGLFLPYYSNSPELVYVVQGRGIQGTIIPGCPETYQESQQGQQGRMFQDQHQKIRRFSEGDILAVPAGVAHWCYNDGNSPVVVVSLVDISHIANQLDQWPRQFFLAGNRPKEGQQQEQYQQPIFRGRRECNNLFCGFVPQILADAFNVDVDTVKKLQNRKDKRGSIVRVKEGGLQVVSPPKKRKEDERQSGGRDNGLDETLCTMKLTENIGEPSKADLYIPQAGRISTLNSHTLPVLRRLQLSAEKGVLYRNGVMVPHWNQNAHSIIYVIRGSARVQVVDNFGQTAFDDRLRKGQILTVPQNYAVVKRAESEGFDWIAFKTNDNAMTSPLSGKTSAFRAMPEDVLVNAFQISREEARRLKFNVRETTLTSSGSRSERSSDA